MLSNTIIFQRFTNKNSLWNEGSDFIHSSSIIRSIEMIKQHPIIGFGLGKVGYSVSGQSLITDGTFWIYLLEWGVPICLFYWGFVCNMIINIARWIKSKVKYISSSSLGFFVSNSYLIVAGLINSAYSARINLIYNWLFAGIIYVMIRNKSCDN